MVKYDIIKDYSKNSGAMDDLMGSFIASVFSHNLDSYTGFVGRIVTLGYAHKFNLDLTKPLVMPNPEVIAKDLIRMANHTNVILATVFVRTDFQQLYPILSHLIELLFDVGYRYNGAKLGAPQIEEKISSEVKHDVEMDDDIAGFLRDLLDGDSVQ